MTFNVLSRVIAFFTTAVRKFQMLLLIACTRLLSKIVRKMNSENNIRFILYKFEGFKYAPRQLSSFSSDNKGFRLRHQSISRVHKISTIFYLSCPTPVHSSSRFWRQRRVRRSIYGRGLVRFALDYEIVMNDLLVTVFDIYLLQQGGLGLASTH